MLFAGVAAAATAFARGFAAGADCCAAGTTRPADSRAFIQAARALSLASARRMMMEKIGDWRAWLLQVFNIANSSINHPLIPPEAHNNSTLHSPLLLNNLANLPCSVSSRTNTRRGSCLQSGATFSRWLSNVYLLPAGTGRGSQSLAGRGEAGAESASFTLPTGATVTGVSLGRWSRSGPSLGSGGRSLVGAASALSWKTLALGHHTQCTSDFKGGQPFGPQSCTDDPAPFTVLTSCGFHSFSSTWR